MSSDPLLDFATEAEARYLRAVAKHGGQRKAAKALGVTHSTISKALARLRKRAAARGYSPEEDAAGLAPEGYHVRGKSVLRKDEHGNLVWTKTNKDAVNLKRAADAILEEIDVPQVRSTKAPKQTCTDEQLAVYPIGDAHIGLLAWGEEAGEDHDLQIARADLARVSSQLIGLAPATERALIVNVGDFFHADNHQGMTERGGNVLDTDSRWPKMVRVGFACMREMIDAALQKHSRVEIVNACGNHDKRTSYMLSLLLAEHYRQEPRVLVRTEPTATHYVEFGQCLIGVTHGDKAKPAALPEIMAADQPLAWGRTRHRYWYTGHVHHDQRKEFRGCMFESFRTLARSDAYHIESGYRSGKDMKCIILDAERGEVLRHTVGL